MPVRICVALLICVSVPAYTQQQGQINWQPASFAPGAAPDTTHGLIRLDVNVTDKSGNPIIGLTQQDFSLFDNGQSAKVVTLDGMDSRSDPPTEVILVIDELNLPPVQVGDADHEAENFLHLHNGRLDLPVCVYRLNDRGLSVTASPSTDGNALADEIAHKKEPRMIWKTSMVSEYLTSVSTDLAGIHSVIALGSIALEERRKAGRKLMFWLSSGWQFSGTPGKGTFDLVTELSTRLREARIDLWMATKWPMYGRPVPLGDLVNHDPLQGIAPAHVDFSPLLLNSLVLQAGGGLLETGGELSLKLEQRIKKESTFYSLTFDPARTNVVDEYHSLKVGVDKPDLTIRTTIGYFDEPVFYYQPPPELQRVSADQFESALKARSNSSGTKIASELSHLELTERLSTQRLRELQSTLGNKKAREELVKVTDESDFLPPPSSEIPTNDPPDLSEQHQIIARAIQYVVQTVRRLPNLFAERTTIQYHERPPSPAQTWKTIVGDQSLYQDETSKATVVFRDGDEIAVPKGAHSRLMDRNESDLNTAGTFGAVLATVIVGASESGSQLAWSRWEKGSNGLLAVFHYRVPRETPLYVVSSNFLTIDDRILSFEEKTPYHGEFVVDPASGAILRLTIQADLDKRLPLQRADIMVEYAPVVIGGISYVCPKRSVSISISRTTRDIRQWIENFKAYAPFETKLSDMVYDKYHLFHSTSLMLPGVKPAQEHK